MSNKLYVFQWPSYLGGADTKLDHTLSLIREFMDITVIPNMAQQIKDGWGERLESLGIKCMTKENFEALPSKLDGNAISFSNGQFISGMNLCRLAKSKGLKVFWGNEMMWYFPGEIDSIKEKYIDAVLYTSKFNRDELEFGYVNSNMEIESYIVGNYIDPTRFPYKERNNEQFTIGRLSREDLQKYSVDFPIFYESLGLRNPKYRVMAWDEMTKRAFSWHQFGSEWDLLQTNSESTVDFLQSLDLFVYKLGHTFKESWGRSTVEAMLTGCIPIVPTGHNFSEFIIQDKTGYMCNTFEDYRNVVQELQNNVEKRKLISKQASAFAASVICKKERHEQIWRTVFNVW